MANQKDKAQEKKRQEDSGSSDQNAKQASKYSSDGNIGCGEAWQGRCGQREAVR
jgi:hypothetical protein